MKELYTLLPGGDLWGPYLEQSPVSPTELVDHPLKTLRSFFPAELGNVLREAVGGYAQVLLFLVLSAVIALLLGERADGTLLDLVCAGGCGVLLWEKLVALSDEFCVQIESWNRFLLGFLPVYAGVLTLGGESAAGASASGFFLTLLCFLAQGSRGPAAAAMLPRAEHGVLCQYRSGSFWLLQSLGQFFAEAPSLGGQTSGGALGAATAFGVAA